MESNNQTDQRYGTLPYYSFTLASGSRNTFVHEESWKKINVGNYKCLYSFVTIVFIYANVVYTVYILGSWSGMRCVDA